MKISFPRHILYLTLFSILMIVLSVWFATAKLIPMGKEYRKNRITLKKEKIDLERHQEFYDQTLELFNQTKTKNRHIIEAFGNDFDPQRFQAQFGKYFIDLSILKARDLNKSDWYEVYEVQTTSKIKSPTNFYDFLEALNKSDWIIGVTFPINFVREGELIHSSFKMQVYKKSKESNTTKKPAAEK